MSATPFNINDWLKLIFLQTQFNGTSLPNETYLNFLSPLSAVDNPTNQSIDISLVNTTYLTQATWYIDPTNGLDSNDGLTSSSALQHWSELQRRWGLFNNLQQTTNVFLLGNLPISDPMTFLVIPYLGNLNVYGGPTTTIGSGATALFTGTLSSVVLAVPASNTATTAIDIALTNWNTALTGGTRIRVTSGARLNHIAYPLKDLGGGVGFAQVRLSYPQTQLGADTTLGADPYVAENLLTAYLGTTFILPSGRGALSVNLFDIHIKGPVIATCMTAGTSLNFNSCVFDGLTQPTTFAEGAVSFQGCQINSGAFSMQPIGFTRIIGGCFFNTGLFTFAVTSDVLMSNTVTFQGHAGTGFGCVIGAGGFNLRSGQLAVFDSVITSVNPRGSGLYVGSLTAPGSVGATIDGTVYGSGSVGWGVDVAAGSRVKFGTIGSPNVVITGASGDFILGGETATLRAFNDTTGVYTAVVANTWALYKVAVIGTNGFGGGAHNVQKDSHLLKAD